MEKKEFGQYLMFDKGNRMLNTIIVKISEGRYMVDPRDKDVMELGRLGRHMGWVDPESVDGDFTDEISKYGWEANSDSMSLRKEVPLGEL